MRRHLLESERKEQANQCDSFSTGQHGKRYEHKLGEEKKREEEAEIWWMEGRGQEDKEGAPEEGERERETEQRGVQTNST